MYCVFHKAQSGVRFQKLKGVSPCTVHAGPATAAPAFLLITPSLYCPPPSPQGFTVLGFPCNQFGAQEPGSNSQVKSFAKSTYNVSFVSSG